MRLVMDMQGAQGEHAQRGIGYYTQNLARALIQLRGDHEVILAFNGALPIMLDALINEFSEFLPRKNMRVWYPMETIPDSDEDFFKQKKLMGCIWQEWIQSLNPDVVLISSVFDSNKNAATVDLSLTFDAPVAAIFYDLIPLLYPDIYLSNEFSKRCYFQQLGVLRRADLLLSISQHARQEAIQHLDFPQDRVVHISSACSPKFKPQSIDLEAWNAFKKKHAIQNHVVLYTGGIDVRKNIERLIEAYGLLPGFLRQTHQLVLVCAIESFDQDRLTRKAQNAGLKPGEFIITGFVTQDELIMLYRQCRCSIMPSWHEGFGLPVLEAMACGRAVIGAHSSGVAEIIERKDALFDPFDVTSMARCLRRVLVDSAWRLELERGGLMRAADFSWEKTASRTWSALELFHEKKQTVAPSWSYWPKRPTLAYVSPLPPAQSEISDYSATLLPELARHYEIDVVVHQQTVTDPWIVANCPIRDVSWFKKHHDTFDRVLYHVGNSMFHAHMLDLLNDIPGVVVAHDLFISNLLAHLQLHEKQTHRWNRAIFESHGYAALYQSQQLQDLDMIHRYPCNLNLWQQAIGVIAHSDYAIKKMKEFYFLNERHCTIIPHCRHVSSVGSKKKAREVLNLPDDALVVCSFGMVTPSKLSDRILNAWLQSDMADRNLCYLVFVGEMPACAENIQLQETIQRHQSDQASIIRVTGYTSASEYQAWLCAADVGIQLRTHSRGETSGAVLDCMGAGLPTIVNAHGTMVELPPSSVYRLPDLFSDSELALAIEYLCDHVLEREALGLRARDTVRLRHHPRACADQYRQTIERFYQTSSASSAHRTLKQAIELNFSKKKWPDIASVLSKHCTPSPRPRQLLLDISVLVERDSKTGIQRVVRAILYQWLIDPPNGWRMEPVYFSQKDLCFRYARRYVKLLLKLDLGIKHEDTQVEAYEGDLFLGLDLCAHLVSIPQCQRQLKEWKRRHVRFYFIVYDLLPIQMPQYFVVAHHRNADAISYGFVQWLLFLIDQSDGLIGISKDAVQTLQHWIACHKPDRLKTLKIDWFHLGADIRSSIPSMGLNKKERQMLIDIKKKPMFLIVSTLEPRKGHVQTLKAFERLWAQGIDVQLVFVGQKGWIDKAFIQTIKHHPELHRRFFWLKGISDEYLEQIYAATTCLLMVSEGEGFGLPLIEAAMRRIAIIARDIPIFREIAGEHAFYFKGLEDHHLAQAMVTWLDLHAKGQAPSSENMPWITWKQSADLLWKKIETMLQRDEKLINPDVLALDGQ